jgi:phospholipase/carboxylesterase
MLDFTKRPARSGKNRYVMFLLHGYYGSGENMMGLADHFTKLSDNICFIAPNAPDRISDDGYRWFPLDTEYITPEAVSGAVAGNHRVLRDFLVGQIKELGVDYGNVFILGFSQGAMMALYTGIRLGSRIGGIVSFSGLQPDSADSMKSAARTKQRILMVHSPADNVVPYECLSYSQNLLESFGFDIIVHSCQNSAGHFIDQDCLRAARDFIGKIIRDSESS